MSGTNRIEGSLARALAGLTEDDLERLPITQDLIDAIGGRHVALSVPDLVPILVSTIAALEARVALLESGEPHTRMDAPPVPSHGAHAQPRRPAPGPRANGVASHRAARVTV